jgi:hypothetical protein
MATLLSVVSEHPAPMLRAGPLEPVLRGLLTKDPAQRSTASQAARQLAALHASPAPAPAPPSPAAAPSAPPRAPRPVPGGSAARIDAEDLKALASASKAVLGSVARDAREHLADRRREKKEERRSGRRAVAERAVGPPQRTAAPPQRRRKFKRRWVVVPVLTTVVVIALLIVGGLVALAAFFGLL